MGADGKKKEDKAGESSSKKKEGEDKEEIFVPIKALHDNLGLLEVSVTHKDENGLKRVLRKNTPIRRTISVEDFKTVMELWVPTSSSAIGELKKDLALADKIGAGRRTMDIEEDKHEEKMIAQARKDMMAKDPRTEALPEVEVYLGLFLVKLLLDGGKYQEARQSLEKLLSRMAALNRHTLDIFQAKAFQFYADCCEKLGQLNEIRGELLHAHRTACLRLDEYGQATLINLILRNFIENNLINQAVKFAFKAHFPESVSNNQQVRNLYYMGQLSAIQLDYSLAFQKLTQAIRKTPSHTGLGFRIAVYKLASIVQLLMGETPERSWFSQADLALPLQPYFELVKAVRNGSLSEYDRVREAHGKVFEADKLSTLIVRLRNSVIRTGLRRINMSYSKISFKDIAKRLALDSPESAELACAKAIRDGVIEAKLDHDQGHMRSSDVLDIYSTIEPQHAFHKRIQFCLDMHNEAVKAMRYPPDAHKAKHDLADDEEEKKTEEEIAKEIEEDLGDDE